MQKNAILVIALTLLCLAVHSTEASFPKALRNCTAFTDSGTVSSSGMNIKSTKHIIGWQGDKCIYKENVSFSGIDSEIVCRFTKPQLNELASVLEAYELMQKYADEEPDFSDLDEVQKNPAVRAWQKYLANESICKVSAEQN